jgi:pimeloyl-ACP methyl ester carboxylesterase
MTVHGIELSAGTIEYEDSGGEGPAIVLLYGFLMDASLWGGVTAQLSVDHRCLAPTLPLARTVVGCAPMPTCRCGGLSGSSRSSSTGSTYAMSPWSAMTPAGRWCSSSSAKAPPASIGSCLLPATRSTTTRPALTGKALVLAGKLPPTLFGAFMQQMRLRRLRRLPIAFGWPTIRGDAATARWMKPVLQQPEIRRDVIHALRAISAEPDLMLKASECLPSFDRPALVVWARQDRVMPRGHGRRLAELLLHARLVVHVLASRW